MTKARDLADIISDGFTASDIPSLDASKITTGTLSTDRYVDNDTVYTHPTSAGNKHIPTGGSSGEFLKYDASGTAVWAADNDTVYSHPTGDGNKHIPSSGSSGQFLKYTSAGTATWAADNDTVYTHPTTAGNKHIPSGGATDQVLTYSSSGTAAWADPAGGGKCLSVVSTPLATIPTTTSTSWVDISGFSVTTGTLDSTSSKLLIWVMCMAGTTTSYNGNVRMKITPSGGSAVYPFVGSGAPGSASRWNHSLMHGYSFSQQSTLASTETLVYLYSVSSTVAHTVQMQWLVESGGEIYLNRSITEDYGRGVSSVTIMEIGA